VSKRLLLLCLSLIALVSLSAQAEEWRKTFSFSATPDVAVDTNDADIRVYASERKDVEAIVTTQGYKIGPNDLSVTDRQTGDRLDLKVHVPHGISMGWHNRSVRIELNVPRQADLNLHTGDGNIRLQGVKGKLRLDTGDGEIEALDSSGPLKADTRDGNVRVDGVFSAMDVHTGDGNILVTVGAGSKMDSSWLLDTGDGNVDLRLPEGFSANLDAHTGDGRVRVDFPVTVEGGVRETSIRGKMNGGGQPLEMRSGDGNITVGRS
jgi:DUF4097 and DUF4098 domain-containing protein YvlB